LKYLIVNADDLGADEARNTGIFEAIDADVVTSVSILANGPALQHALEKIPALDSRKVSFGVHLNISEGLPLCEGLKEITDGLGRFFGKAETHRCLMQKGEETLAREIRREFAAQIAALKHAGIRVSHLDGHQHVHVFPAAVEEAVRVAREFGIPWIRIPEESCPVETPVADPEARKFSLLAVGARNKIAEPLKTTDHFRGLYLKGKMSIASLERTIRELLPGLTELMVHPGRVPANKAPGPFSSFSIPDRERELEILTGGNFLSLLRSFQVQLVCFPEA
jgi:chitin disaccharide deacetylase